MSALFLSLTALLLALTLIPLTKTPHGLIRGPAFGRQQWTVAAALLLIPTSLLLTGTALWLCIAGLALTIAINAAYIAKFTPLWPKQSTTATAAQRSDQAAQLSVLTANIKLSNRDYDRFLDLIDQHPSDIIIVIEPDADWLNAISNLKISHPHHIEHPLDTGYGLAIYSKRPLSDVKRDELVTKGVPSIRCNVELGSGSKITLFAVHPEPPIARHDTIGRDSEIALIGLVARDTTLPAIVTGDLNDVAWSTTTRRFQRLSGLLDPRVGRGFYNTFHAHIPLLRWPLDHLFHDKRFNVISLARLPDIGSDHFPMRFSLALTADETDIDLGHDPQEEAETIDMIQTETKRPRDPIGTDWET